MFTIQQIKDAHSKVKSGADFPRYMQDLIALGVKSYETFVFDNHTDYYGENDFSASSQGLPEMLSIAADCKLNQFKTDLKYTIRAKRIIQPFVPIVPNLE